MPRIPIYKLPSAMLWHDHPLLDAMHAALAQARNRGDGSELAYELTMESAVEWLKVCAAEIRNFEELHEATDKWWRSVELTGYAGTFLGVPIYIGESDCITDAPATLGGKEKA